MDIDRGNEPRRFHLNLCDDLWLVYAQQLTVSLKVALSRLVVGMSNPSEQLHNISHRSYKIVWMQIYTVYANFRQMIIELLVVTEIFKQLYTAHRGLH